MTDNKLSGRSPRASEGRVHDSRSGEEGGRKPIRYSEGSAFNVPEAIRVSDPEHSYAYIPYHSGGKDLTNEYDDAIYRRGFMPVKRSSHPLLKRNQIDSPFARQEEDDLIKYGGQILMKRTLEDKQSEDDFYNERNARQNYIRELHSNSNPGSPKIFQDERKYSPGMR